MKQTKQEAVEKPEATTTHTANYANNGRPRLHEAASYAADAANPYNQANHGTSATKTKTEPNTTDPNTATAATDQQQASAPTDRPKQGGGRPFRGDKAHHRR